MNLPYHRLAAITLLLTYLLIVIGGATRVFDAGMSCPDWPHCYGAYIPFPESSIPGGYIVGAMHYQWWQVALEWSHRTLAATIGVLMLALVVLAIKRPAYERKPLAAATLALIVQISLGAFTIFQANSPLSVALHLGTAMLFFASLVWLRRAIAAKGKPTPLPTAKAMRILLITFAAFVWCTMVLGALTSSGHAGGVCGGLFSCAGQWFPADPAQHIHMQHRFFALATMLLSISLISVAKRAAPHLRKVALHLHIMVWGQVGLGIATLYSFANYPAFYQPLSIAHLAWGTLVWLAAIGAVLNLSYGNAGRFHPSR